MLDIALPIMLIGRAFTRPSPLHYIARAVAAPKGKAAALSARAMARLPLARNGRPRPPERVELSSWPRHGDVVHPHEVSRRLVHVQESVRREVSDYLHGHVQSKLLALSMSLGMCQQLLGRDPEGASQVLDQVRDELQRVQDEDLRQVSRDLYPSIIKMGLAPALRSLASRFSDTLQVDLDLDPGLDCLDREGDAALGEKQRLGIYRIVEEAMTNVVKHAGATRLEVRLSWDGSRELALTVSDNGRGFNSAEVPPGQGLVGMSDYAAAMGGSAEVSSAPGAGATVRFTLPLAGAQPAPSLHQSLN